MVSSMVPCGTWAMKFYWGSAVTSTGILSNIGKSLFIWNVVGPILVDVGKHSKRTFDSSRLGTSMGAVDEVCALGMESLLDMVTVSLNPWKGMFSMSYALEMDEDEGIGTDGGVTISLMDEPFLLPIFCFFYEGSSSMISFNIFYCRLQKSAHGLETISYSFSSNSLIIDGTIGSMVSHHSIRSAPNISSGLVIVP